MSFQTFYFLTLIEKFHGERSISGIYHLLRGKRSSQTLQDRVIFAVQPYFQSIDTISREEMATIYHDCEQRGLIECLTEGHYCLSQKGLRRLDELKDTHDIPEGLFYSNYIDQERLFWKKLSLTVQSLSHLNHQESRFLPVSHERDVLDWTKRFLKKMTQERSQLSYKFFLECHKGLSHFSNLEATIFVQQLSGFQQTGLTLKQIARVENRDIYETTLLFKSSLRALIHEIDHRKSEYPLLSQLVDTKNANGLTVTAEKTRHLIDQGLDIRRIADIRHLTMGTIEDHLVEITMHHPDFEVKAFVSDDIYIKVKNLLEQLSTKRLKRIRVAAGEDVSYFQIRLVMAKESVGSS